MLSLASVPFLTWTLWQLHCLKSVTGFTTMEYARRWAFAAVCCCLLGSAVAIPFLSLSVSDQLQSAIRYFAAVMLLTPLLAVLGARQPGVNAWPWFVLVPLIAVLQWPSVSQFAAGRSTEAVEVPSPTALGFLLVLLMGAGNYLETRHTLATLAGSSALLLMVLPMTEWLPDSEWTYSFGCLLISATCGIVCREYKRSAAQPIQLAAGGTQELWQHFRDLYGIVWAKRVMDRVNQFSARETWNVHLSLEGFVRNSNDDGHAENARLPNRDIPERAILVLCWLLTRFVDREYLQQFLPDSVLDKARTGGSNEPSNHTGSSRPGRSSE